MKSTTRCLLTLLVGTGQVAFGVPILDQSDTSFSSGEFVQGTISVAQTFTPSISGGLTYVDLFLANHDTAEGLPLVVSIYTTQGGVPQGLLGTEDLNNVGQNYAWYSVDYSSQAIFLNANTLYALVLGCPGSYFGIYAGGSVDNSYSGGMAMTQSSADAMWQPDNRAKDLMFQTYMTVPDSTGFGILVLSGLSLAAFTFFQRRSAVK